MIGLPRGRPRSQGWSRRGKQTVRLDPRSVGPSAADVTAVMFAGLLPGARKGRTVALLELVRMKLAALAILAAGVLAVPAATGADATQLGVGYICGAEQAALRPGALPAVMLQGVGN